MGVNPKIGGKPPKWMVYNGKPENPIKMDDLGVPLFLETPIYLHLYAELSEYHRLKLDKW